MGKKAKIIGAAAGVAAAAAATAAVVVTRRGSAKKIADKVSETVRAAKEKATAVAKGTVYHVMKSGDQWSVQADGAARASSLHPNKREAVNAARELAVSKAPSKLVIHRVDGSVQDTRSYDPE